MMHPKFQVTNDNLADLKGDIDAGTGKLTGPSITKPSGQPQTLGTLPSRRRFAISSNSLTHSFGTFSTLSVHDICGQF